MSIETVFSCDLCLQQVEPRDFESNLTFRGGFDTAFLDRGKNIESIEFGDVCRKCWNERIYPYYKHMLSELSGTKIVMTVTMVEA